VAHVDTSPLKALAFSNMPNMEVTAVVKESVPPEQGRTLFVFQTE